MIAVGNSSTSARLMACTTAGVPLADHTFVTLEPPGMKVTPLQAERVVFTGDFEDSIDFGLGPLVSAGYRDILLGVYDL